MPRSYALARIVPTTGRRRETIELAAGLAVVRVQHERVANRFERTVLIAPALLPEPGALAQDTDTVRGVRRQGEPLGVDRHELSPVIGPLVERPEYLDDARLVLLDHHERLERLDRFAGGRARLLLVRREIDHRLVLVDGRVDLAQLPFQQAGELQTELGLFLGQGALLRPLPGQLREVTPAPPPLVEPGDGLERLHLGVVDIESRAVRVDRAIVVLKLGLLDLGDDVQRRDPLRRIAGVVERLTVERDAICRPIGLTQQLVDGLERSLALLRGEGVRAPVEVESSLDVLLLLEQLAGPLRELRCGGLVCLHLLELAGIDLREPPTGVRHAREALELHPGRLVGDVLGEELRDGLQRRQVVLFLLLVQLREAAQQRPPAIRILAGRETRLERDHDLSPLGTREVD